MGRRTTIPAVILGLVLPGSWPARGEYVQVQGNASVHFEADKGGDGRLVIRLSGVAVTVRVRGKAPLRVFPDGAAVRSRDWQASPRAPDQNGPDRWERKLLLKPPLQPGELFDLELVPLRYREGDRPEVTVAWKPIPVRILKPSLSDLRGNTPPEDVPEAWSSAGTFGCVLCVLVLVALGCVGWEIARRKLRRSGRLTPAGWAVRELEKVNAVDLTSSEAGKRFVTVLADVLRRYLEMQFRLPASRRTTEEFFGEMRESPQLTAEQQRTLRECLERCDLVKFAKVTPSETDCRSLAATARAFVEQTAAPPGPAG
jgi:hypothetical protein